MNPAIRESGKWKGQSRLSKIGHAQLRAKRYMPAMTAAPCDRPVRALVGRLVAREKPCLLALAAAMRKLLHITWGVVDSGRRFDPKIGLA